MEKIPYGRQYIDEDDITAVVEILKSDFLTQGPKIQEFEEVLCQRTKASFAVAVNSGTAALHLACLAAGIGSGDEVITSPNTFVASANCAVYCGATPIFADINPQTYNISFKEIEKKINEHTKAVIPVHFAGQSCDMLKIQSIVKSAEKRYGHKIYIIEDACHALGSRYKEIEVGSCTYSDMAIFSFHPVKHITTGEGGVVLTNSKELQQSLSCLRTHGITNKDEDLIYKERAFQKNEKTGEGEIRNPWYYEQQFLGYHYRITDIQCALGISQLKKLDGFKKRRREIVNQYNKEFDSIDNIIIPFEEEFCDSNFHLYVLLFDFEKIGLNRTRFIEELKKKRIFTQVHYIPVYTQPFYQKNFNTSWGDCLEAEKYYQQCLSLPLYPSMTDRDVDYVVSVMKELMRVKSVSG